MSLQTHTFNYTPILIFTQHRGTLGTSNVMMEAAVHKAPLLRGGNWTEATGHRSAGKENSRVGS